MMITQYGWNRDLIRPFLEYCDIITVSGRCGHTMIGYNYPVGRCGSDIHYLNDTLYNDTLNDVIITGTNNRGPWAIHAHRLRILGYLDEVNYYLGQDDHDLNRRALLHYGWYAAYKYISFYADRIPNRNTDSTHSIPDTIKQHDQMYRMYRQTLQNHSCDGTTTPYDAISSNTPTNPIRRPLTPLPTSNMDWYEKLPPLLEC